MEFIKLNENGKLEILDNLKRFPHLVDMGDDYYFDGKTLLFEYLSNEYDYPTDIYSFTSNNKLIGLIILSEIKHLAPSNRRTLSCFDGVIDLVFFPTGTSEKLVDDILHFISVHLPNHLLCYNEFYHVLQSVSIRRYFENLKIKCINSEILLDDNHLISKTSTITEFVLADFLEKTFKPSISSTSFKIFNSTSEEEMDELKQLFSIIPKAVSLDTNLVSKLGFDFLTENKHLNQITTFKHFVLIGHTDECEQIPLCILKLHESLSSDLPFWTITFINTNAFYYNHGYAKELYSYINNWSNDGNPLLVFASYVTTKGREVSIDDIRKTYWDSDYVKHFDNFDDLDLFFETIHENRLFEKLALENNEN